MTALAVWRDKLFRSTEIVGSVIGLYQIFMVALPLSSEGASGHFESFDDLLIEAANHQCA